MEPRPIPLLAVLVALAGCAAVGPDYAPPVLPLPPAWSNAAPGEPPQRDDLSRWWERLSDPLLAQLVAEAMRANPDLRTAQARLREARARRELAGAQLAPGVSASARSSASRGDGEATRQSHAAGFDGSWELDVFGGKRRGVEAAQADLEASAATVEGARVTLAAEVARNYVEARAFQARLGIARGNLASQGETLQLTEWRAQAGLVGSLDVEQARANREQTRAQLPSLETQLAQAQHRLAVLLAQPPGAMRERLAAPSPIPSAPPELALGIPADVLRQRPDLRAAERTLAAETARIGQAEAARYPGVTLAGSIGLDALRLAGPATATRSLLASAAAPMLDGGRLRAQVRLQESARDRAQVAYEAAVLGALEEVENALAGFANAKERRAALALALEAARNAALLARQRYTAGLVDFQAVLDTERSVLGVEDGLAGSEADGVLALVRLYKALGGGWEPAPR